jgi:hypothetical protein
MVGGPGAGKQVTAAIALLNSFFAGRLDAAADQPIPCRILAMHQIVGRVALVTQIGDSGRR